MYIDTTQETEITIALYQRDGQKVKEEKVSANRNKSEALLKLLDAHILKEEVSGIIVVSGSTGRFSAIRTGVTAANILGFALDVPVVGVEQGDDLLLALNECVSQKKFSKTVSPVYEKNPVQ